MKINEELGAAEAALREIGCKDVKFFFAPGATDEARSTVESDAAKFLKAYTEGNFQRVDGVQDRPNA